MIISFYRQHTYMDLMLGIGLETFSAETREVCPTLPKFELNFYMGFFIMRIWFGGSIED